MTYQQNTFQNIINPKYQDSQPHLNPFSPLLNNKSWAWPQFSIPPSSNNKVKTTQNKPTSIKSDIIDWQIHSFLRMNYTSSNNMFKLLNFEQKCAVTVVKNQKFLQSFLKSFKKSNASYLYNIYQQQKIHSGLSKSVNLQQTKSIFQHLCIAWLDQPLIYFNIQEREAQTFLIQFTNWINKISNDQVFEQAHKIKNKSQPQQNLLWFTGKSFQSIQSWLLNQFQKIIIINYYNKGNYSLDSYQKLKKLKKELYQKNNFHNFNKKQLQNLLSYPIQQTKNKDQHDFKQYQSKVKQFYDLYQEKSLFVNHQKKKKKKLKKKSKTKTTSIEHFQHNNIYYDNNNINNQVMQNNQQQTQQLCIIEQESNQKQNKTKENTKLQNIITTEINNQQQQQNVANNQHKEKQEHQNINIFQQKFDKSEDSPDWSNAQTNKTSKKSGQSQPQFNQINRKNELKHNRSLSPQQKCTSISKLKRRGRINRKNELTAISSWNQRQHLTQNFIQSYQINDLSSNIHSSQLIDKNCNDQNQPLKLNQQTDKYQQAQKKKKKRNNKNFNAIKQLSEKISNAFVSKQLNGFIDVLSIQANNLYDHKIVAFERIKYFVNSIFQTSQTQLFGSNAVGLSLPTSDIDIMLFNLPCTCREQATQILAHLAVQINTMLWIVSCSTYLNAKVPLMKLQIDPTIQYMKTKRKCDYSSYQMINPNKQLQLKVKKQKGSYDSSHLIQLSNQIIKVDITINITDQGMFGTQSTQFMKLWMNRYPQLYMCILAFKYILARRGFNSNFKGGIGSYCLFVMIAAYIKEYPQLENLSKQEFFVSTLKFYGEQFENQIKSIILLPFQQPNQNKIVDQKQIKTCFISLEQTLSLLKNQISYRYPNEDQILLYNIQVNPLRIFDPVNNRLMSGSCHLYPQIKTQFRRIYKQLQQMKKIVQKEVQLTVTGNQIYKMLQNKKIMDKWLNKYQGRSTINIKNILDGDF